MEVLRRIAILFVYAISLINCNPNAEITYSYNDINIKRMDANGKTIFYFGEISKERPRIWVEYSGINDGFTGYLKFDESGKVILFSGDGYFQTANDNFSKFEYIRITADQRPKLTENVCIIQDAIRYEQERNNEFKTKVKITYPKKY